MENCPDCGDPPVRRLDPAHSGSHRAAGGSGASHRARLPCSDLPGLSTALHTSGATGRRSHWGSQRLGVNLLSLHRHVAGRGAAAHPQRPVVSGHRASVAPQRGGHRERHSPAGPPRSGPNQRWPRCGLDRIRASPVVHADETGWRRDIHGCQRLRVDFQHPHRTLLPAADPLALQGRGNQGGGGRSAGRCFLRSIGQRFLRRLPPLRWPQARFVVPSGLALGHGVSGRAGPTCCGTSTTSAPATPKDAALARWAAAVHQLYVAAKACNWRSRALAKGAVAPTGLGAEAAGHLPPFPV